ncbi:Heat stress transcription factor B-4c [Platanthera guangdongensis]|uniref:Heat stress transcription factor B-4c n=1 Tax=Platanthera guangdongensis TaxID=2320717 RepID=A0ABR2LP98_9ASPA
MSLPATLHFLPAGLDADWKNLSPRRSNIASNFQTSRLDLPRTLPLLLFGNKGEPAGGGSSAEVALLKENERLRRGNEALISELAHMRRLYNDIIYFVQNHVRPVVPSSARLAYNGSNGSFFQLHRAPGGAAINSGGSATSSSSLTMAKESSALPERKERESSGSPTSLFGVTLSAKRREYPIEPGFNYSTKPQLPLNQKNLSINQISSSSPSSM